MTTPVKWGSEFLLNTTTLGEQSHPAVTALADGRFVVTWTDASASGGDTSGDAIRAQIFNADGSPSGPEFLVNTTTANNQEEPTVTALADGRFVVAWTDSSATAGDTSGAAIRAQAFNPDGTASDPEFLVNTTTANDQSEPTITALANGGFVVAWTDNSQTGDDTSFTAVRAQVFAADGSPSGSEFLVNTTTADFQSTPTITALPDGRFVAAWTDFSETGDDTSNQAVRAQIFNADGTPSGSEFLVNTTTAFGQLEATITALADGRFAIAWSDFSGTGDDTSQQAIRGQVFNADGSRSGAEFLVNTTTFGAQTEPTIAALPDGRFVVAWRDNSQSGGDTSGSAIRAQVFNADGSKSGSEFLVNTTTAESQLQPTITALADGRLMIGWRDGSQLGTDAATDLRGQIFDPRIAAVSLNGTLADDHYFGTVFGDDMLGSFGDDRLHGAAGDDELDGQWGNDIVFGGHGNDQLFGGPGNDRLLGGHGSDVIDGGDGNDFLNGGVGADALIGGPGNDRFIVDLAADMVIEEPGEGQDTALSATISLDLADYPNVEDARLLGTADLDLTGNAGTNRLTGNVGDNLIRGRGGDDVLVGRAGDDELRGGGGDDVLAGQAGSDTLLGGADLDRLFGGGGDDVLAGQAGSDILRGGPGDDRLFGGGGNDLLIGGAGVDRLFGGPDSDRFRFADGDSGATGALADRIKDFEQGSDIIDLAAIDADTSTAGDDAFTFIDDAAFSGTAGELRAFINAGGNTVVQGDVDGDGAGDFRVLLIGDFTLTVDDFLL